MCGIAGAVNLAAGLGPLPLEDLAAMVGALSHRGPDEAGRYRDRRAALGHTRLSIVDLATGQQPLCSEDGTRWVVFNGEIFNDLALRERLLGLGHAFRTASDTEVIVHAWEEWGEEAFERLEGQWALALWDAARGRLVLSRDRLGVRPLHLARHAGRLWFASEAKALFAGAPGLSRELDPAGLAETFTFWAPLAPRTAFAAVRELPPGHLAVVERGEVAERRWWTPRFPRRGQPAFQGTPQEAAGQVRQALAAAVRVRALRAEVPVGAYLSGGLDSTLTAALAREARGGTLLTFSVRFEDPEYDETPWQRAAAARLGSQHRELLVRRADVAEALPEVVRHAEKPLLRTAPAPLFLLSRLVRRSGVKVVLTGEGADELFAGYDLFREGKVRRFWARAPGSRLRPRLLERLYPWLARSPVSERTLARAFFGRDLGAAGAPGFAHAPRWRSTGALQRLLATPLREAAAQVDVVGGLLDRLPSGFGGWTPLAQDQWLEVETLLSGYLLSSQGDRMLMAHSVEGRFPFLDPAVFELAATLPDALKLMGLDEKHVLKAAARGLVPEEIRRRTKQPYRAPDGPCLAGPGAPAWVADLLSPGAVAAAGIFDPTAVGRLWRKWRAAGEAPLSNADSMALTGVVTSGLLHEQLVRAPPGRQGPAAFGTVVERLDVQGAAPAAARAPVVSGAAGG